MAPTHNSTQVNIAYCLADDHLSVSTFILLSFRSIVNKKFDLYEKFSLPEDGLRKKMR